MKPDFVLPNINGDGTSEVIQTENNVVIIGANGAGKTRLGSWIESQYKTAVNVHRISAQRALIIPEYAAVKTLEQAEKALFYGREDQYASPGYKQGSRWGNNPETHLLNDFDHLLSTLFARTSKRDREHTAATKISGQYIPVNDSPIDVIINLWNDIMPQREITFEDGKVLVKKNDIAGYHGKDMSDGERVTLYLIGQCLCAPNDSILIIDEPEIHLHKSLMSRLWNKIEDACPDKLLIFITHDLDFAASRLEAKKIWIKSYNGQKWDWEEIPLIDTIPENLLLEIIGNRKNIIFCEGESNSLDTTIYRLVYPEYHIIPRAGGDKVVEATKTLRNNPSLHHLNAYGIIDSDYKEEDEIIALEKNGIYTLDVAEVENIFCTEEVLKIIASHLALDPDDTISKVIDFLIDSLESEFELQVSSKAEKIIEYKLGAYSKKTNNKQGLIDAIQETISNIDVEKIYEDSEKLFRNAIDNKNLERILFLYNRKSLISRISSLFGLGKGEYEKLLIRLLRSEKKEEIITALKKYLPNI